MRTIYFNIFPFRKQQYPPDSFVAQDNYVSFSSLKPVTKNGKEVRRAGGSEATKWPQPGSHEVALGGLRGQRPLRGLNLGATVLRIRGS